MTTSNSADDMFHLRIKSFKDVEIAVPPGSVVAHVKQQVRAAMGVDDPNRYLRLICKGRLLFPDDHPISDFNVQNGDVVHAVLAPVKPVLEETQRHRRRHMVIGPGGRVTRSNVGDNDEDESTASSTEGVHTGFDRLRDPHNGIVPTPLSRAEVTVIRAYFSRHVDRYLAQQPPNVEEPDPVRRRHQAEEEWMALQGPTSEFRLNLNQNAVLRAIHHHQPTITVGTDRDFMWVFMLGFFVGFVMLVWVWMPTVPHKQKLGILAGISFQLAMNVFSPPDSDGKEEDYIMED